MAAAGAHRAAGLPRMADLRRGQVRRADDRDRRAGQRQGEGAHQGGRCRRERGRHRRRQGRARRGRSHRRQDHRQGDLRQGQAGQYCGQGLKRMRLCKEDRRVKVIVLTY